MELKDPFLSKEYKWAYSLQKEWITSHDEQKISTWFKSLPANLVFARKGILMLLNFKRLKEFVDYFVFSSKFIKIDLVGKFLPRC